MKISIKGKFTDSLYSPDNTLIASYISQPNMIVYSCLDLVANLLKNQPGMEGVLYLAVGEGADGWDASLPREDPATTRLAKEIFRKRTDIDQISYSKDAKILTINVELGAEEAVGTLREFGLFGGDAADTLNSGFMINYKIHPVIDKTMPKILKRSIVLSFGPDVEKVKVPRLLGLSKEDAEKKLLESDLSVGRLSFKEAGDEKAGKVLDQNPIEDTLVAPDSTVDLVIGERINKEIVPDVTNSTKFRAEKALSESGWKYKFTPISAVTPDAKIGRVYKQEPAGGTYADKTTVEIGLFIALHDLRVEAIEGIGVKYGGRFRGLVPSINTLEELSLIDEKKLKISGISGERLVTWKYMSNLMTTIKGLDGNGAEILVKGKNIKTPEELAAVSAQEFQQFYAGCIESAKKIKIPREYIKNYFTQQNVKSWIAAAQAIINP